MAVYVIEVYRAGLTAGSLRPIADAVAALAGGGREAMTMRYLGGSIAPDDEVGYIRIEAPSRAIVEALVNRLAIRDARVSEVIDLG